MAAGFSSRFGGVKLCAPLRNGRTVLQETVTNVRSTLSQLLIITRPELLPLLVTDDTPVAVFAEAERGMGATLSFGIQCARSRFDWDGCLICLGDMPFIRPDTYLTLANALRPDNIVLPVYAEHVGNPTGFGRLFFESLTGLQGDQGGRDVVRGNSAALVRVPLDDPAILQDIDTPEELARYDTTRSA